MPTDTDPQDAGRPTNARALEALLEETIRRSTVPGLSVAVVKNDRVVWERGFGFANLAAWTPATPRTIYMWFSMTKIMTATAVLRFAEGGNLDLDAPVDKYFRGFKVVSQPVPVTVRHLLNHSSGLANPVPIRWIRPAGTPAPDQRAFVNRLLAKHRKLKFVPGRRARYSNLGYLVPGEVVSEAAGIRYEEYIRDEILVPLGMKRTGFSYPESAEHEVATAYQPLRRPLTPLFRAVLPRGIVGPRYGRYVTFNRFYVDGAAYGGMVGSVDEAIRFVLLHLNGGRIDETRLLLPESVAMMQQITPRGARRSGRGTWPACSTASRLRGIWR